MSSFGVSQIIQKESLEVMMEKRRYLPIAAIAAVALVAAACSSSDDAVESVGPVVPPMPVMVDLDGVTAGTTAEAGTIEIAAGMSMDSGNTAFACADDGEDCTVVTTVDADDGTVSATSTGGTVTAGNSATYQAELDAAAVVAATAAAATKLTAIAMEAVQATDDGPGGTGADPDHEIAIARDSMATTVTIAVDGAMEDDPGFVDQEMDLGAGNSMHVFAMEADEDGNVVEEVMIVSTDIEAPTATLFADVDGQELTVRDLDDDVNADDEGEATDDWTAITVNTANSSLITSAAFTAGTMAVLTFDSDDTSTNDMDEAFETAGTYNGAMGTYRCDGASDCMVNVDGEGEIESIGSGWIFTPDEGATSDVADADYLHYGFWLQRTTDADGVLTYDEVETFADSNIPESDNVAQVTGSARYLGGATGVYVSNNEYDSATGDVIDATSGFFTADADLRAYFAQTVDDADTADVDEAGMIPPNMLNTLTGTIDNFMLQHGEVNTWSVNLQGNIVNDGVTSPDGATGGGAPAAWSATFHGPTTDDTQPHTVVGEFNANFGNGSAAGGFGARTE